MEPKQQPLMALGPNLWAIRNRVFTSITYIGLLENPNECLVIDPGLDRESLDQALTTLRVHPVAVFCTHGHFDHIGGASRLKETFGTTLHVHAAERKTVQAANFTMMVCKVEGRITIPDFDVYVDEADTYLVGPDSVRFLHTPGHTTGSAFVLWRDVVFTGDTLYRDGVGLVSFPGEDVKQLRKSLERVWTSIPDTSLVCPGHGGSGRFADIKRRNSDLRDFLGLVTTSRNG